jgi:uncharacterized radical SAM superfamily Fe-S cluster-containing enzyme
MDINPNSTQSLCPVCLQVIPAARVSRDGDLYLEKECPQHGLFSALIWRGAESYEHWGDTSVEAVPPNNRGTVSNQGCPYDCGLCPDHQAQTCTAIMEVTQRCNLGCPVCFASSSANGRTDPDLNCIERMYRSVWEYAGNPSIQLSGGEPTIRDDLPEIIKLGKTIGFSHIQINTNGLRIARDPDYLAKLVDAGADLIYLQFDGVEDSVYQTLRGRDLFEVKVQAIQNCARAHIGVLLVPTVIPGYNLNQLGDIVQFAKSWIPYVKGIHFQPISYFGRYPEQPGDKDRVTLPDVIHALVEQTEGELRETNFLPRRSKDAHCSFNSIFVLREDGKLQGRTNINYLTPLESLEEGSSPAILAREFVNTRWRLSDELRLEEKKCCCSSTKSKYQDILEEENRKSITITCMPFQDVWNIDFERLRKCCVHVVTEQGKLVPFCAYYLTSITGERLY